VAPLAANNSLTAELRGKPGGTLTLEIVGIDDTPPEIIATVDDGVMDGVMSLSAEGEKFEFIGERQDD